MRRRRPRRSSLKRCWIKPNDPDRAAFFGINGPVNINDLTINEKNREIDFTNDRNRILNLINSLEVTGNSPTPLYDALFRAIKITALQQAPRAMIVITDGQDKVSKLSADDPISEANRNNIPIFPIGFSRGQINNEYLTRLAARTGGTYTPARDAEPVHPGVRANTRSTQPAIRVDLSIATRARCATTRGHRPRR